MKRIDGTPKGLLQFILSFDDHKDDDCGPLYRRITEVWKIETTKISEAAGKLKMTTNHCIIKEYVRQREWHLPSNDIKHIYSYFCH